MDNKSHSRIKVNISKFLLLCTLIILSSFVISCEDSSSSSDSSSYGATDCYHNDKLLFTGPQGGCYYINSNGNKTYVDRSECD